MTLNPWDEWEDYQAGLYEKRPVDESKITDSVELLSNPDEFYEVAREMIREWDNSARQNLYLSVTGRQAWVGQASCCYHHGATAEETRQAWGKMSSSAQFMADGAANRAINEYLKWSEYGETLFGG